MAPSSGERRKYAGRAVVGDASIRRRAELALGVPLLRFLGASLIDEVDPSAGISLSIGPNVLNAVDVLHGGVTATALDIAAYLAILPELSDNEEATTHALFVSYIARPESDTPLVAAGRALRRGRRVAFVASELHQGTRLLASAQVTKAVYGVA